MQTIAQFEKQFTIEERSQGVHLLNSNLVSVQSIIPNTAMNICVGAGPHVEFVQITFSPANNLLEWNCSCELYESGVNCRHLWASLLVAEKRNFFDKKYSQPTHGSEDSSDLTLENSAASPFSGNFGRSIEHSEPHFAERGKREALFILITPTDSYEDWSIRFYFRNSYKDGSKGRWESETAIYWVNYSDYEPKFRPALKALASAYDKARYQYIGNSFSPEIWKNALIEISKTMSFLYLDEKGTSRPLEVVESSFTYPMKLEMKGSLKSKNLLVHGSLFSRGFRVPLTEGTRATKDFAIVEGKLYCSDLYGSIRWIEQFKKTAIIQVQSDDIHAFLASLYLPEVIPKIELPPQYSYSALNKKPKARLVIERANENNLSVELEFKYGDEFIDKSEESHRILNHEQKTIHVRQIYDERELKNQLFNILERKAYGPGGLLLIKESKLTELVFSAFELKWEVVAFKKTVSQMSEYKIRASSGIDWFDLHLDMRFNGGATLPFPDLLKGIKSGKKMIALADGSMGILNEEVIQKFSQLGMGLNIVNGKARISKIQALFLSTLLQDDQNFSADQKFRTLRKVRELSVKPEALMPDPKFKGKLRSYQKKGLGWLDELSKREIGCLLADDMGLGKTVSILALLSKRLKGQALIVVPKTILSNWLLEAERFVPHLRIYAHYGSGRNESRSGLANTDIVLTTYHTLRSDIDRLKKIKFEFLVLDEAQWIKNSNSDIHKACRLVTAQRKIALTGTPIENSIGDLFSIFNIITPGLISKGGWEKFADADDPTALKVVRKAVAPFVLRRRKEDVLKELPKKAVQVLYSNMNTKERRDYNHLKKFLWKEIKGEIDKNGIRRSSTKILTALLRLRQASTHQGLLKKNKERLPSSKFELLFDQLETIINENHKVLIFSNFRGVLNLLKSELTKRKIDFCFMDGTTSNRNEIVKSFQNDSSKKVFLMTIKTGGVGLNLTSASYVFIMDPWWNPATESQAIDRTHRIGQKNKVTAYKLISKDTVEEKVLALQSKKSSIAKAIVEGDKSKVLRNITEEDLQDLFS